MCRLLPRLAGLAGLALLLASTAAAQPVLDAAAVPGLDAAGRAAYADFLLTNLPRAFAIGGTSGYGWQGGSGTAESARAKALEGCAARGAKDCKIYADDLDVVWDGRARQAAPPPGPLVSNWNYAIVPDARYFWRGAGAAAGVVVWGHGFGAMNGNGGLADARGTQPPGWVRAFNNAGFDVVRFDRDPNADARDRAAGWLQESLVDLRRRGYRKVVAGGQSRGSWNSLQMLEFAGLADAVIAVSPAAHGSGGSTNLTAQYDDLRQLVNAAAPARTRLAFMQFAADPFAGDLAGRRALIERLRPRLGGLLVLDQPEGFRGHFGGNTTLFAKLYGPCLLHFIVDPSPSASCPAPAGASVIGTLGDGGTARRGNKCRCPGPPAAPNSVGP